MFIRSKVDRDIRSHVLSKGTLVDLPSPVAKRLVSEGAAEIVELETAIKEIAGRREVRGGTKPKPKRKPKRPNNGNATKPQETIDADPADSLFG